MSFLITTPAASTGMQTSISAPVIPQVVEAINKMQGQILVETMAGNKELDELVQFYATMLKSFAKTAADMETMLSRCKKSNADLAANMKSSFDALDLYIGAQNKSLEAQNTSIANYQAAIATLQQQNADLAPKVAEVREYKARMAALVDAQNKWLAGAGYNPCLTDNSSR